MQISAASLLAAQQQAPRPAAKAAPQADGFAPLLFKENTGKIAAAAEGTASAAKPASPASTGPVRPGIHIDIKI